MIYLQMTNVDLRIINKIRNRKSKSRSLKSGRATSSEFPGFPVIVMEQIVRRTVVGYALMVGIPLDTLTRFERYIRKEGKSCGPVSLFEITQTFFP